MDSPARGTGQITCPFCEVSDLRDFGRNSARCDGCGGIIGGEFLELLRQVTALPDSLGRHACECGHPEMRLLPDAVYRCPACGAEILPASAGLVTWKPPGKTDAFRQGWLDGRFGEATPFSENRSLSAWDEAGDRLDYYRGHRAGYEVRMKARLAEAS